MSSFDASEFLRGLDMANERVQHGARRGFVLSLAHLERKCKEAVPVETGTLAGTIVGAASTIQITPDGVAGHVAAGGGEAADYAIRQHEEPMQHSHPRPGVYAAKFVEGPLKAEGPKCMEVVADEIRGQLG
ncbi:MAG: hypothetical protein ABFD92_00055 [Planctomycetaceae bacterium]|nr:hypothetical protein [Planctomycetaceae bacterium]